MNIKLLGIVGTHHHIDGDIGAVIGDLFIVVDDIQEGNAGVDCTNAILQTGNVPALQSFLNGIDHVFQRFDLTGDSGV